MSGSLNEQLRTRLDALLEVDNGRLSGMQRLNELPEVPSPAAILRLTDKLERGVVKAFSMRSWERQVP